ncbi:hypothetical protein M0R72_09020 [Candidatus Pacearchaeota archaeon]|jgi:hypothetical protein|nr:hypothetical protein [Candidatus Pacearchaeota archaeon]
MKHVLLVLAVLFVCGCADKTPVPCPDFSVGEVVAFAADSSHAAVVTDRFYNIWSRRWCYYVQYLDGLGRICNKGVEESTLRKVVD